MSTPKFKPGDRVWMVDRTQPAYRDRFVPHVIMDLHGDDYIYCRQTDPSRLAWMKPIDAIDREWKSDHERAAMIWDWSRTDLAEMVLECDIDRLRKVAEALDFRPDIDPL